MSSEHTQRQSDEQKSESRQLSLRRTRPPLEIPGYEPRQFLGSGAYGEVWVAIDQNTGRRVAIKFYTQRSGIDWSLLSREVEKLVFLSANRYVVQLLDVGWNANPPYYVMEYVENGSLDEYLQARGTLPAGQAVELFREVALGLLYAHGKGVLHCDLKPANILLDEDMQPRLADFGQSRLSHEQTPALGTLFYMAPEQADLAAMPDARWDVYALGALLYRMLVGKPPYRSEITVSEIDSADDLEERLLRYRWLIERSPTPTEHRRAATTDRELAEIIDRCLAVDPEERFPNVQSVIDALQARDTKKDWRPLKVLGLVGPLLFLLIISLLGWRTSWLSEQSSDRMLKQWVLESSRFAAQFVSEAVARRIEVLLRSVEIQAEEPVVQDALARLLNEPRLREVVEKLADDSLDESELARWRAEFTSHPLQRELQGIVELLRIESRGNVASWFITDRRGVQLAAAFATEPRQSTVGGDYSDRDYFHGRGEDLDPARHHDVEPIQRSHLSTVFKSEATGNWKIAVSTPIRDPEGEIMGVVALTVELGELGDVTLQPSTAQARQQRFVTLVDGRPGRRQGIVLQHPMSQLQFAASPSPKKSPPNAIRGADVLEKYKIDLNLLSDAGKSADDIPLFHDPLSELPGGEPFRGKWIAAKREVVLGSDAITPEEAARSSGRAAGLAAIDAEGNPATIGKTGLVVIVQENYDTAVAPIKELRRNLMNSNLFALFAVILGVILLWSLVVRTLFDPNEILRRIRGPAATPPPLHSMETVELPDQLRR